MSMLLRLTVVLLASLLGATANANPNLGPQKTAVIAVKFSASDPDPLIDRLIGPLTYAQIREMIFDSSLSTSLNAYIREVSYGKAWLAGVLSPELGDVFGWYTLNITSRRDRPFILTSPQYTLPDVSTPVLGAALKAADGDIDFRNYSRIILLIDHFDPTSNMGTSGLVPVTTGDSLMPINASVAWFYVRPAPNPNPSEIKTHQWPTVIRHEVGHNFGPGHANLLDGCGAVAFCDLSTREYGDPFDVLGSPQSVDGRQLSYSPHYNAAHKEKIGWLDSTSVWEVTKSGMYTILPLESQSVGYKTVKIPRPGNSQGAFFIEYRQRTGIGTSIDSSFDTYQPGNNAYKGALIRYVPPLQTTYPPSLLIDTTPGSIEDILATTINDEDFIDAALTHNKTFTDGAGISVTTVGVFADLALTVEVKLPVSVSGFWPANGAPGSFIFVFGSDFVPEPGKTKVTVNGIPAPIIQVLDSSLLFFMLPGGNTAGPITVTTALSSGTSAVPFGTPSSGVTITGVWPAQGPVGSFVFVFGTGYVPQATKVFVNGLRAPLVQALDASMLFFMVPNGATNGPVSLQTSVGSAVSATPFMVLP